MIVDALFTVISAILSPIFSALPTWSLLGALGIDTSKFATVGNYMALVNGIFPVAETLTMVVITYSTLLGVFVTYKLANWVYRHLPDILGFGPGGGG